jgi:hypothetical protein
LVYWFKTIDWPHWITVIIVFSMTGSFSLAFGRLLLTDVLNLDGSLWAGPWAYRFGYLLLVPPLYSAMLIGIGSLFGKHDYFKRRVLRMWSLLFLLPVWRRYVDPKSYV